MSWVATARNNVSLTSVDLPEPETPVTQVISPSGNSAVTFFRLLAVAPTTRSMRFGSGERRKRRNLDAAPAAQVLTGDRIGMCGDLGRGALRDDCAAVHARPGTQVDDVIRLANRILVVLHHDHRVAEIAQIDQRIEQALIVALVQADRGLIENVHDADQPRADLAREPDALRLAARQGIGAAIEREIAEPDVAEESQPIGDFLDDLDRDLAAPAGQLQAGEELRRAIHADSEDTSGAFLPSMKTFLAARFEPGSPALGARPRASGTWPAPRAPSPIRFPGSGARDS